MGDLQALLSSIPGGSLLSDWLQQLALMTAGQRIVGLGRLFFQFIGLWEFVKYVYRWIFKRRSRLEQELESLEHRVHERNAAIAKLREEREKLTAELQSARSALPGAAVARAEGEFRELNPLRVGIEIAANQNRDRAPELRGIIVGLSASAVHMRDKRWLPDTALRDSSSDKGISRRHGSRQCAPLQVSTRPPPLSTRCSGHCAAWLQ